jgi:hypothetical protein
MKKTEPKKVLYLFGNEQEFGQALSNIIGLNPDLVIHQQFTTSTVRQKNSPITNLEPPIFEAVIMAYLVYTNPTEIKIVPETEPGQDTGKIKATLKPVTN